MYRYQDNRGESAAVNAGLSLARGRYSLILNSDDCLRAGALAVLADSLRNGNYIAAYPDFEVVNSTGEPIKTIRKPKYSFTALLGDAECLPGPGTLFLTDALKTRDIRDLRYRYVSDYHMWLKMALRGDFVHVNANLAQWRSHDQSTSIREPKLALAKELLLLFEQFLDDYEDEPRVRSLKQRAISSAYFRAALMTRTTDNFESRRFMLKSVKTRYRNGLRSIWGPHRVRSTASTLLVPAGVLSRYSRGK